MRKNHMQRRPNFNMIGAAVLAVTLFTLICAVWFINQQDRNDSLAAEAIAPTPQRPLRSPLFEDLGSLTSSPSAINSLNLKSFAAGGVVEYAPTTKELKAKPKLPRTPVQCPSNYKAGIWDATGRFSPIDRAGSATRDSILTSINNHDHGVGTLTSCDGTNTTTGFYWNGSEVIEITGGVASDINNNDIIVGYSQTPGSSTQANIWKGGEAVNLHELIRQQLDNTAIASIAQNINDAGVVIGTYENARYEKKIFVATPAESSYTLVSLGSYYTSTQVVDINNMGHILGVGINPTTSTLEAFVWRQGEFININSILSKNGYKNVESIYHLSLNNKGAIAGTVGYTNADGKQEFHGFVLVIPNDVTASKIVDLNREANPNRWDRLDSEDINDNFVVAGTGSKSQMSYQYRAFRIKLDEAYFQNPKMK